MKTSPFVFFVPGYPFGYPPSGVRATPTFFVNGKPADVSHGVAHLFEAVREMLKS